MIWSIIPEDFLFESTEETAPMVDCIYQGRRLLLRPCGQGLGEIVSLLSTNPGDFLDYRFQTGRRIPMA